MNRKFDFYEIVKIVSTNEIHSGIHGKEGVILGMSQNEDNTWGYAVFVNEDTWDLNEKLLKSTGKISRREEFYNEQDKVKIIVDEKGKGKIVDRK